MKARRGDRPARMGGVMDWFRRKAKEGEPAGPPPEPGFFERIEAAFRGAPIPPAPPPRPPGAPPPAVNYYAVLGVPPTATLDEIRAAYRAQAKRWHPDIHPGDPEALARFRYLSEAYDVLADPERRAKHDRALATAVAAPPPPPGPPPTGIVVRPEIPPVPAAFAPPPVARPPARVPPAPPPPARTLAEVFGMIEEPPIGAVFFPPPAAAAPPAMPPFARPPSFAVPPAWAPPAAIPAVPPGARFALPSVQEMAHIISTTWPLGEILGTVRENRGHPEFLRKGLMVVMPVAGFDPREGLEYELSDRLGVPRWVVQDYARRGQLTTGLWRDVFQPLFDTVGTALDALRPADVPGGFALGFDESRTRVELVYYEGAGSPRP